MDNFKTPKNNKITTSLDGIVGGDTKNNNKFRIGRKRPVTPVKPDIEPDIFIPNNQINIESNTVRKNISTDSDSNSRVPVIGMNLGLPEDNIGSKSKTSKSKLSFLKRFASLLRPTKKKITLSVLLVVVVAGFMVGKGYLNLRNIFRGGTDGAAALDKNVDPNKLKGEGDGRVNVLLLGRGGEGETAPDLTDTIVVASLDPVNNKVALLSIPRDLWVKSDSGDSSKINAVFALTKEAAVSEGKTIEQSESEGFAAIEKMVTETMGIPIHYHAMIDFSGFKEAIDTIGGIDINVDENGEVYEVLRDHSTASNYVLDVKQGQQHFDGRRALFYSRSRYTSARGDFDRAERQRKVMVALKDKILTLGTFANPAKVSGLMSNFGNHIQTNMSLSELMRFYNIGKSIDSSNITSVGLADPPNDFVTTDMIGDQSVVVPRAGISDFSEIKKYVRNTLKDGFIQKEDPEVVVYNGTNIDGLATTRADELKSYGYRVTKVDSAPTRDYSKTVLIDLRNGEKKYTKHYLEERLGVTASSSLPDGILAGTADFVIIVGSNEYNSL